jgi:hypothetical protein
VATLASVAGLALPASAGSDKYYSVTATSAANGTSFTITLTNDSAIQSFGSAELQFGKIPSTDLTVTSISTDSPGVPSADWSSSFASTSPGVILLASASSSDAVAPRSYLAVTVSVQASTSQTVTVYSTVKQSNDFNGPNNEFQLVGGNPTITVSPNCGGSSSGCTLSDSVVSASLSLSGTGYTYTASLGGDSLPCDSDVSGTPTAGGITPTELYVDVTGTVSKTVTLTFPKSVVNAVPSNGTNQMPVCAGSDHAFPSTNYPYSATSGTLTLGDGTTQYYGDLLACDDPSYTSAIKSDSSLLPVCIQDEAKKAANEIVTITVASSDGDYLRSW